MKLDLKEWISKVTDSITKPSIVALSFSQPLTSKTTGSKTASVTISVPSGYEVIPNCRPISLFISGNPTVTVTDRTAITMNGSTASFNYYLYNPNSSTVTMQITGTILCRKVGGGST